MKSIRISRKSKRIIRLLAEIMIVYIKSLLLVKDDFDKLKKTHSKLVVENDNLKTKNLNLEKEVSGIKVKYEEISLNVKEFNKGKEKLHDLLKFQNNDKNKFGLGFDEKSAKKVSSKTKIEDVFIKKQPSFKVSNDSKKEVVYNKNISTNFSNHSLNETNSFSRRQSLRLPNRNSYNNENFYSNRENLRYNANHVKSWNSSY